MNIRLTVDNGFTALEVRLKTLAEPPPTIVWDNKVFHLDARRGDLWQYVCRPGLPESPE